VDAELDTLATALYVRTDDLLKLYPEQVPYRPQVGIAPQISDAEIITLSVMQALLGHSSEARWLRQATAHLKHLFPYLPQQPGYNKRLRKLAGAVNWLIGMLGRDTSVWTDDVWVVDSTPVECGRSRETTRARTWLVGPSMATAQAIPTTSGDCDCTWSPPCRARRSATRSPARRPTNVKSYSTC